jgi:hypothetical protein
MIVIIWRHERVLIDHIIYYLFPTETSMFSIPRRSIDWGHFLFQQPCNSTRLFDRPHILSVEFLAYSRETTLFGLLTIRGECVVSLAGLTTESIQAIERDAQKAYGPIWST